MGEPMDFCLACCDNEFGMKFIDQRKQCKQMCSKTIVMQNNGEDPTGTWAFIPARNKIAEGQAQNAPQVPNPPQFK